MTTLISQAPDTSGISKSPSKFLGDLGKATMRGVRKCTKCGTLNGTRGARCKNKLCDAIFKSISTQKSGPEAAKIITGTNIEIYSVRLNYIGIEQRDFVQLPLVQDLEGNPAIVEQSVICSAAKCYALEQCPRASNDNMEPCRHIKSAVESEDATTALTFKNSVLNSMPISNEMRQEIWSLATEMPGPLVQRVSKNAMLVKAPVNSKYRLGFLHVIFSSQRRTEKKFTCECFMKDVKGVWQKCIHYYACVCAFASDDELSKVFRHILKAEGLGTEEMCMVEEISLEEQKADEPTMEIVISTDSGGIEVAEITQSSLRDVSGLALTDSSMVTFEVPKPQEKMSFPQESAAVLSFKQWLSSVIERIHQTMHFQNSGTPDPLIMHIPHQFWDCFLNRMSNCGTAGKRRLPDQTQTYARSNGEPRMIRFTWQLYDLNHVCKIFSTSDISLQSRLYFTKNSDDTFSQIPNSKVRVENIDNHMNKRQKTKEIDKEYTTLLRLHSSREWNFDPTPFTFDWFPDMLPLSKLGELRLTFQFAHAIDGIIQPSAEDVVSSYTVSCLQTPA